MRTPLLPAALACLLLAGCAGSPGPGLTLPGPALHPGAARVSAAQACAIGYDLARSIHDRVSLRRTVIVAPKRETACERHALEYLRRAGFRIDRTGQGGVSFDVTLDRLDADTVSAVAEVGGTLRIARLYRPVRTGVLPAGPVSVQDLDPDTYASREATR